MMSEKLKPCDFRMNATLMEAQTHDETLMDKVREMSKRLMEQEEEFIINNLNSINPKALERLKKCVDKAWNTRKEGE